MKVLGLKTWQLAVVAVIGLQLLGIVNFVALAQGLGTASVAGGNLGAGAGAGGAGGASLSQCTISGGVSTASFTMDPRQRDKTGTGISATYTGNVNGKVITSGVSGTGQTVPASGGGANVIMFASGYLNTSYTGQNHLNLANGVCSGIFSVSGDPSSGAAFDSAAVMPSVGGASKAFYAQNGTAGCEDFTSAGTGSAANLRKSPYVTLSGNTTYGYFSAPEDNNVEVIIDSNVSALWDPSLTIPNFNGANCISDPTTYSTGNSQQLTFKCPGNLVGGAVPRLSLNLVTGSTKTPTALNTSAKWYLIPRVPFYDPVTNAKSVGFADSQGSLIQTGHALFGQAITLCGS